ncbi:GIY-YIG nuclease family protein [Terrimonas pollutisoli]|uniref:GIY-YIG nuclease family protein n=1 Tax=Terrimonas pollutisoli TaxID=3034147 RepID=UPI0023EDF78D|nr:GIY-YIG nuclease family protein [Terrimonas sp. H1YJ31]
MPCRVHKFKSICNFGYRCFFLCTTFTFYTHRPETNIGYTADIGSRLVKHNSKHNGFTQGATDWIIVFSETFSTKQEALKREQQIKSWKSPRLIENLIRQGSAG